jgi:hypothetical protein
MTAIFPSTRSAYKTDDDASVADLLRSASGDECWAWYTNSSGDDRPRFVILGREIGVLGLDVVPLAPTDLADITPSGIRLSGNLFDPVGEVGPKIESLRRRLPSTVPLRAMLAFPRLREADFDRSGLERYLPRGSAICSDTLVEGWKRVSSGIQPLDKDILRETRSILCPESAFKIDRRETDQGADKRRARRILLDDLQEDVARAITSRALLLTGVAGSGKTLVLCARARILKKEHPDWRIQVLCFNRALIPYIKASIGDETISVDSFHQWAFRNSVTVPFLNSSQPESGTRELRRAIDDGRLAGSADAILIDEGQDFSAEWLRLAWSAVSDSPGGIMIAADPAQSIYREEDLANVFDPAQLHVTHLRVNYRNTRQIAEFALLSVYGADSIADTAESASGRRPERPQVVLDGDPVQVWWGGSWNSQAEFVAREIKRLVAGSICRYRDVAVLYTQRAGTVRRLLEAFEQVGIPVSWLGRDKESRSAFDLAEDTVKLLTVHSAKGLQFPVVFLFGLEALDVPSAIVPATEEQANRMRVAYVGMTRAENLLYVTYTRSNPIIDRVTTLGECAEFQIYPEDYVE